MEQEWEEIRLLIGGIDIIDTSLLSPTHILIVNWPSQNNRKKWAYAWNNKSKQYTGFIDVEIYPLTLELLTAIKLVFQPLSPTKFSNQTNYDRRREQVAEFVKEWYKKHDVT